MPDLDAQIDRLYQLPLDEFTAAFDESLRAGELTTIVAKVDATGPAGFVTDLALLENRFQFARWMRSAGNGG